MREPVTDTLMFLNEHPKVVPLYACLEETVYELFPAVNKRVHKTQISFSNRRVFACVSFARVKRKAELPDPFIVLTLGLPDPLESAQVAAKRRLTPADGRRISSSGALTRSMRNCAPGSDRPARSRIPSEGEGWKDHD